MKQVMITGLEKDFLVSHIRTQINTLQVVLASIENSGKEEFDFAAESLKRVESGLKRVRNFLNN